MPDKEKDSRFEPSAWFRPGDDKSEVVRNLPGKRSSAASDEVLRASPRPSSTIGATRPAPEPQPAAREGEGGGAGDDGRPVELAPPGIESKGRREFGFTEEEVRAILAPYHARADRMFMGALCVHLALAFCLAPFYRTWAVAVPVAFSATAMFALAWALAPQTHFTRCIAGVALQTFVALHIYQMHGLPEMHFFFFTSATLMVACFDWKAMWPGTILIIGQHILFAVLTNYGEEMWFFPEKYIEVSKLAFHFGIAVVHVAICGLWAYTSRRQVLLDARQRQDIARLALIARNTRNSVVLVDAAGRVAWANPAFFKQTGYLWEEIRGKELAGFLAGVDTDPAEVRRMRDAIVAGEAFEGELCQYTAAGKGYWVSRSLTTSFDSRSGLREYVVVDTDVSQQRRASTALRAAKDAAETANRSKDYFLANVSHELRTPLNGVLGLLDALLADGPTAAQQELMTIAREAAASLNILVDDLLDLAKIEAGKLELAPTRFSLHEEVAKTLRTLAGRAHDRGVELAYLPAPDVPAELEGDPVRLRQILTNLASNAVKFTEAGSVELAIEAIERRDDSVRLRFTVRDTGIGIPKDKLEAIFAPFQQADPSTTRKYGGTGLGLAIVRRLVELMGGEVVVRSRLGQGSEFTFAVWFSGASEKASPPPPAVDRIRRRGGIAWVVEDHLPSRETWARWLREEGVQTAVVDSAEGVFGLAQRSARNGRTPAVVVVDDALFRASQAAWTAAFQESGRTPQVVRASAVGLVRRPARPDDPAQVLLAKPFTPLEFWEALDAALAAAPPGAGGPQSAAKRPAAPGATSFPEAAAAARVPASSAGTIAADRSPSAPSAEERVSAQAEASADAEPPAAASSAPKLEEEPPLEVLLVEDNRVNQLVARLALERAGHRVALAENGKDAVDLWRRKPFDVILMDVQMPVMDGVEATTLIRAEEAAGSRRTPIVAMTARAMKGDAEACVAAGMDAYLAKPLRWDEVRSALERLRSAPRDEADLVAAAPAAGVSSPSAGPASAADSPAAPD